MLEIQKKDFLDNKLVQFLSKVLAVIYGTRESSNPGSLNSYMVFTLEFSVKFTSAGLLSSLAPFFPKKKKTN